MYAAPGVSMGLGGGYLCVIGSPIAISEEAETDVYLSPFPFIPLHVC